MLDELVSDKTPLISVIIPTFNSGKFIGQAVQSVLDQTYRRLEIIVVDDGSTDTTKDIVREFNSYIQYYYQENRGPSAARNAGIKIARGDYICFLDADDIWMPNKLEVQLAFMKQYDDISLVFSDSDLIDLYTELHISILPRPVFRSGIISQVPIQDVFTKLLIADFIPTSMVMVRKQCFAKAGLFDEGLRVSEDLDMWLRIASCFKIAYIPLILGKKRIHESNISRDRELILRCRLNVWRDACRRFPNLAPAAIVNNLVANTYLDLGYILLAKDHRKDARQAGLTSLTHAARAVSMRVSLHKSVPSYRWFRGVGLIPLTFMGRPMTQSLRRAKNTIFKRKAQ